VTFNAISTPTCQPRSILRPMPRYHASRRLCKASSVETKRGSGATATDFPLNGTISPEICPKKQACFCTWSQAAVSSAARCSGFARLTSLFASLPACQIPYSVYDWMSVDIEAHGPATLLGCFLTSVLSWIFQPKIISLFFSPTESQHFLAYALGPSCSTPLLLLIICLSHDLW
jgi:hypothetical protein